MLWYIPLISTLAGAVFSFFAAYFVSWRAFNRQVMFERTNLLAGLNIEITTINRTIETSIRTAHHDSVIPFLTKKDIDSLCSIYKGNAGRIGLLEQETVTSVVTFYSKLLSIIPRGNSEKNFNETDLVECSSLASQAISRTER